MFSARDMGLEGDLAGHLLRVAPDFGRYSAIMYTPRDFAELKAGLQPLYFQEASSLAGAFHWARPLRHHAHADVRRRPAGFCVLQTPVWPYPWLGGTTLLSCAHRTMLPRARCVLQSPWRASLMKSFLGSQRA